VSRAKLPHVMFLGGGAVIKLGDETIGAIGAAGAPGAKIGRRLRARRPRQNQGSPAVAKKTAVEATRGGDRREEVLTLSRALVGGPMIATLD
jgi:hypothetical protein